MSRLGAGYEVNWADTVEGVAVPGELTVDDAFGEGDRGCDLVYDSVTGRIYNVPLSWLPREEAAETLDQYRPGEL